MDPRDHGPFLPWRTVRRIIDLWVSLWLLVYLFGDPLLSEFGVPYAAKRHAVPVMDRARDRAEQIRYIRQLENDVAALLDLVDAYHARG